MAVLPIITGEKNPILRAKTKTVQKVSKDIVKLLKDMQDTLIKANGAGIAAPQVGRTERICLAVLDKKIIPLINPKITWSSKSTGTVEEGCLSLPDLWIPVQRPNDIVVEFMTPNGKTLELKLSDFDARVVQHEIDHLDGVLITDYRKKK